MKKSVTLSIKTGSAMKINIIACTLNMGIGHGGSLLCSFKEDFEYFKSKIKDTPVVMGKNTFMEFKEPFNEKENIVISSTLSEKHPVTIKSSLRESLEYLRENDTKEVFILGGTEIYKEALPLANEIYITLINPLFKYELPEDVNCFPDFTHSDYSVSHIKTTIQEKNNNPYILNYIKLTNLKKL